MSTIRKRMIERLDLRINKLLEAHKRLAERSLEDRRLNVIIHRYMSMRTRLDKPHREQV